MPIFHEFPYGNTHDQNYDWILQVVKDFQSKYTNFDQTVDDALNAIEAAKDGSLEDMQTALTNALTAIAADQATAQSAIAADQATAQSAIAADQATAQAAIASDQSAALLALQAALTAAITSITTEQTNATQIIEQLYNTLPASAQDILGRLNILDNIITGYTPSNAFQWLQGGYVYPEGVTPPTPPAIDTDDPAYDKIVSSLYMTGCAGQRLRISTDGTIHINHICCWFNTPPGGAPGGFSIGQEGLTPTFGDIIFPLNTTAFSIELKSPDGTVSITPADVIGHIDLRWVTDFVGQATIAPKETSNTANVARETNEFFFLDGVLYKALNDIEIGDTIVTSGAEANCEETTIGYELYKELDDIADALRAANSAERAATSAESGVTSLQSDVTVLENAIDKIETGSDVPFTFTEGKGYGSFSGKLGTVTDNMYARYPADNYTNALKRQDLGGVYAKTGYLVNVFFTAVSGMSPSILYTSGYVDRYYFPDDVSEDYFYISVKKTSGEDITAEEAAANVFGIPVIQSKFNVIKNETNNKFNTYFDDENIITKNFSGFSNIYPGQYENASGSLVTNGSYTTYELAINSETKVYLISPEDYTSLGIHAGVTFTRYRKSGSENTLPTSASPLTIMANSTIRISIKNKNTFRLHTDNYELGSLLGNTLSLNTKQLNQVKEIVSTNNCKVIYYGTSETNNGLLIYTPSGVGFIRYDFKHCYDTNKNADNWRIDGIYSVDNDLVARFNITVNGEMECAIHLVGRDDFSGGILHGDEVTTELYTFIDGALTDMEDLYTLTNFKNLTIVELTNLYDPADHETIIAVHGKEYVFEKDQLTVNQYIDWKINDTLADSYLAMLTTAKSDDMLVVTDHFYTNKDYSPLTCLGNYGNYPGNRKVTVYARSSGLKATMAVPVYPLATGYTDPTLLLTDNNGQGYNKFYFRAPSSGAINNGDRWDSKTVYTFEVGEIDEENT